MLIRFKRRIRPAMLAFAAVIAPPAAHAQNAAAPWIGTKEPITILSANDGQYHLRINAQMQLDHEHPTRDSITVIHLGPDHPPIARTTFDLAPNSISGVPSIAMTGDGHYGFVPNAEGRGYFGSAEPQALSVIDLTSEMPTLVQKLEDVPVVSNMLIMHPDGKRLLVPVKTGIRVYEMKNGKLSLVKDNQLGFRPEVIDIDRAGARIAASIRKGDRNTGNAQSEIHMLSYKDGVIADLGEIKLNPDLAAGRRILSFRITPDGKRVLATNGPGVGTKGTLDDILVIDTTVTPAKVEVVPQVTDGVESMAVHPSGKFAVISGIEELPHAAHVSYSRLSVIDLTTRPARLLYQMTVEPVGEGIEFTPDGTQLFVQFTNANIIAAFDVDGMMLKRNPFDIRVGHGPASMALGRSFKQ